MDKPWFVRRRRLMGYNIRPVTWQGWLVIAAFTAGLVTVTWPLRMLLEPRLSDLGVALALGGASVLLVGLLLLVSTKFSVSGETYDAMKAREAQKQAGRRR